VLSSAGIFFSRGFETDSKYGGKEKAYAAAVHWLNQQLDRFNLPKNSNRKFFGVVNRKNRTTGIVGVQYQKPNGINGDGAFCATWVDANGKPKWKSFAIRKYGQDGALSRAIAYRKAREAEFYHPKGYYMPNNTSQTQQSPSCFISYNHKDENFVRQLYARMQAAKISVFYAPEDIKGGRKIHEQIERAIELHEKLLLVLSDNSLRSEWVMTEIRKARRDELVTKRRKLFPIRLVDIETIRQWKCFDADSGKDLAVEVREYFIPDFSKWGDYQQFEDSFKRLIKDLQLSDENDAPDEPEAAPEIPEIRDLVVSEIIKSGTVTIADLAAMIGRGISQSDLSPVLNSLVREQILHRFVDTEGGHQHVSYKLSK
jgi:TIR domain/AP2 domain